MVKRLRGTEQALAFFAHTHRQSYQHGYETGFAAGHAMALQEIREKVRDDPDLQALFEAIRRSQ